jgi:hypothetical protein
MFFTGSVTFNTTTDKSGAFTVPLPPGEPYAVSVFEPGKESGKPVALTNKLKVGSAGQHNVGILEAPFAVSTTTVPADDDLVAPEPIKPPVVNSVTFVVNSSPVTVQGNNNSFTVDLTGYQNSDVFSEIIVDASKDAATAEITLMGITETISFNDGVASATVDGLLGLPGLSLAKLKTILELIDTNEMLITVVGNTGIKASVTVSIVV